MERSSAGGGAAGMPISQRPIPTSVSNPMAFGSAPVPHSLLGANAQAAMAQSRKMQFQVGFHIWYSELCGVSENERVFDILMVSFEKIFGWMHQKLIVSYILHHTQ